MKKETISIIGGGPVGALLSIYLVNRGYNTLLYEQRDDIRIAGQRRGRSINLALSDRGIRALETAGIAGCILNDTVPMYGRSIHDIRGGTVDQPYGRQGQCIRSIGRHRLNCRLLELAEEKGVKIHFRYRCTDIDLAGGHIHFVDGSEKKHIAGADVIFAADGARSAARASFIQQQEGASVEEQPIDFEYKELSIPASPAALRALRPDALHIWPRSALMLIALPNPDNSFTGTLFLPSTSIHSFTQLSEAASIEAFLQETFPGLTSLVPDAPQQLATHPISGLSTILCKSWTNGNNFSLVGDAAHGILPFFGQGMNAGFEDCRVLNGLIDEKAGDWTAILGRFQALRKVDTDAIADLAFRNFIEMREKTADPRFLLQKKIEARLHEHHPDKWVPAYTQVTFRPDIRYSEALTNSLRQERIMQHIMSRPDIETIGNGPEVEEMILARL